MTLHPETDHPVVAAYLDHLRVERRLAIPTVDSYGRDLRRLAEFAATRQCPLETLESADVEAFLRRRPQASLIVRRFYRFLVLDRRISTSPVEGV